MARTFTPFDEHHPDFFARVKETPRETCFTGQEQGIVEQTYFSEDDPTYDCDPEFDSIAYRDYVDECVAHGIEPSLADIFFG